MVRSVMAAVAAAEVDPGPGRVVAAGPEKTPDGIKAPGTLLGYFP